MKKRIKSEVVNEKELEIEISSEKAKRKQQGGIWEEGKDEIRGSTGSKKRRKTCKALLV